MEIKWKPLKKTSLKNLGAFSKLNPYAKLARRNALFAEVERIKTTEKQLLDVATLAFRDEAEAMEKTMLATRHKMLQPWTSPNEDTLQRLQFFQTNYTLQLCTFVNEDSLQSPQLFNSFYTLQLWTMRDPDPLQSLQYFNS
ncbi:hypothetical protein SUGI_0790550 [Cryptomeria japonica]|nr:hypothetical protein SUGI_0790550 [Cryptomeria japonica]